MSQSMPAPVPTAVPTPAAPPRATPRRRTDSRTWVAAAAGSVLLHLLIFALVRFELVLEPRTPPRRVQTYDLRPVMQAYDIVPITVAPGQVEPVLPPPRLEVPERQLPTPAPALPAGAARPGRAPTLSERLGRTPTGDLELWRPVEPGDYERPLTDEERLRARLAARMDAYNDSTAAAALAAERATDWTAKDGKGGKWGVSPGKVHLGGVTLPLPVAFTPPPGRREEVAARTRSWSETQAQASRAEASDNFDERVKAIRARRDAARDSARTAGGN